MPRRMRAVLKRERLLDPRQPFADRTSRAAEDRQTRSNFQQHGKPPCLLSWPDGADAAILLARIPFRILEDWHAASRCGKLVTTVAMKSHPQSLMG